MIYVRTYSRTETNGKASIAAIMEGVYVEWITESLRQEGRNLNSLRETNDRKGKRALNSYKQNRDA